MINTLTIYNELKESLDAEAAEKIAKVIGLVYDELRNSVTKTEFNELKEIVKEISTELKGLAQSQKGLSEEVKGLAQSQKELSEEMKKLAAAQGRTETSLLRLQKQVGGLSDAVGGDIEEIGYIVIHRVLQRDLGWEVGVLERTWQKWGERVEEIDLLGKATDPKRSRKEIWIVGEAKHNLTLKQVHKFSRVVERARKHLRGEIYPVCFCYRARPEVQEAVRNAGFRLVFSYEYIR